MPLTVGSLFAGIGGFDLGFERAGFTSAWRCETEPFCRRVLAAKFPNPCTVYGDVRGIGRSLVPRVDVLVGGFPCQDLSVAGQRRGLGGERSGLFFQFVRLIQELRPSLWVIENVPGFLSSARGTDFAVALRELDACGYVGGWRVLDSQYFGLAQRRERVFLVGGAGRFRDRAQTILFESEGRNRDSQAGDTARSDLAATLRGRSHGAGVNEPGRGGEDDANLVAFGWNKSASQTMRVNSDNVDALQASASSNPAIAYGVHANQRGELRTSGLAGSLTGSKSGKQFEGVMALQASTGGPDDNSAQAGHLIPVTGERERALVGSMFKRHDDDTDTLIPTLTGNLGHHGYGSDRGDGSSVIPTLSTRGNKQHPDIDNVESLQVSQGVRRLTPLECERLQGFPDGWTCLCGEGHRGSQFCTCKDTPRYKALGNAVSVPVAQWIAERIKEAEGHPMCRRFL